MGAAATIEVSFLDKSGQMISDEEIQKLNKQAQEVLDSFDFSNKFYAGFASIDAYSQMAVYHKKESDIVRKPWC